VKAVFLGLGIAFGVRSEYQRVRGQMPAQTVHAADADEMETPVGLELEPFHAMGAGVNRPEPDPDQVIAGDRVGGRSVTSAGGEEGN
jgi:hypothetical protein